MASGSSAHIRIQKVLDTTPSSIGVGWEFDFSADDPLVVGAPSATTGSDGFTPYVTVTGFTQGSLPVTISEVVQTGWTFVSDGAGVPTCQNQSGTNRAVSQVHADGTFVVAVFGGGDSITCTVHNKPVPYVPHHDVGIVKSYTPLAAVEAGSTFGYTLVVTNEGPDPVTGVTVEDTLPADLVADGAASVSPAVLSQVPDAGNPAHLVFTGAGPFAPGAIATITIPVKVKDTTPITLPERVGPGDPIPTLPSVDMGPDIPNQACVTITETDENPANDCSDVKTPVKRINPNAYVRCENDVPYLHYNIALTPSVDASLPITATWTSANDGVHPVQTEVVSIPAGAFSGAMLWPGTAVDSAGLPTAYPGYRALAPGDDVDSPNRFNDLFLDESVPSFAWRNTVLPATITFSINPSQAVLATYPLALAACAVPGDSELSIQKTASVDRVDVGDDFSYTLAVSNVGAGASSPVEIFDEIPADLRVDGISYGLTPNVSNWDNSCAVTGTDSSGYGGVLHCTLDGILSPARPKAPDIILNVHVNDETTALSIENTGEVCWRYNPSGVPMGATLCDDDTVKVLVKQVLLTGAAVCRNDTPYFTYSVTPTNLTTAPQVLLIWWTPEAFANHDPSLHDPAAILADGATKVEVVAADGSYTPGQTITGEVLWPGAAVDAFGNPIAWPGWKQLPNGVWVLDPADPFFQLRDQARVEIRVNPTTDVITSYPPASPNCNARPPQTTPAGLASTGFDPGSGPLPIGVALLGLGVLAMLAGFHRRGRRA